MTLAGIYKKLPTQEKCLEILEKVIWDNKPVCPYCGRTNVTPMPNEKRYHCNKCTASFSVTVRTVFHRTRCDLQKWFFAIYIVCRVNREITARGLAEKIETTKDTAWLLLNKIKNRTSENQSLFDKIIQSI